MSIARVEPPGDEPATFELVIEPETSSMIPDGDLDACFEVYHEHEDGEALNPRLRRLWKTARVADLIAYRLLSSGALGLASSDDS